MRQSYLSPALTFKITFVSLFLKENWTFWKILPTDFFAQIGYCSMLFIPGLVFVKYGADHMSLGILIFFNSS